MFLINRIVDKISYEMLVVLFPEEFVFDKLSYDEVISYFVNSRPKREDVAKGAIFIDKKFNYYNLIQVFIDKNDNLVFASGNKLYGRKIRVKIIDDELKAFLGENKMIIIE